MTDLDIYERSYADALEHVEQLFNRLFIQKKLCETCKECNLIGEVEKIRLLIKDRLFSNFEEEIGYTL